MTKKLFALIIAFFTIIFTSSIIFAEDNNNPGGEWKDSVNKTENTMHNIGNGIESAISGVMDTGKNVVNGVTNNNMTHNNSTNNNTTAITGTQNNNSNTNYTAVRTNTDTTRTGNLFGLSNTALTWIIMILSAAVIVSLIYFYGSQYENRTGMDNRDND